MTNTVAATLALIALVVGPARAVQPQRMIMHEGLLLGKLSALPPWLSALGVSLVGHEKAQHMVRSMSKVTAISTLGVTVNVTALAKDDTIGRLQKEFANRRDAWGRDCGDVTTMDFAISPHPCLSSLTSAETLASSPLSSHVCTPSRKSSPSSPHQSPTSSSASTSGSTASMC